MDNSISGINVKIGADLSDLKKKLGKVGDTVESELGPAKDTTKTLNENFKKSATNAAKTAVSAAAIAVALGKVGKALLGFSKGILEDALKLHPDTQAKVEAVNTAFNDMKAALGETLIPLIEQWAPKLTIALDSITGWIQDNPEAAKNIMLVVGAIGAMSTAASVAVPALMLLNVSLSPISATALAVAAAVGGLVLIIGMLIAKMDELSSYSVATADEIEHMDTATEQLVQNGFGELEIQGKKTMDDGFGNQVYWDQNTWNIDTNSFGAWVTLEQDLADTISTTSSSIMEQASAMSEVTEATETTKSASEEVNEVLTGMQETLTGITETTSGDLTESMSQINEILESEAFQQFMGQPVAEDTIASYQQLAEAVTANNTALGNEETGMIASLSGLPALFDAARTSAEAMATYLSTEFVASINAMLAVVCITSTDEEGNVNAGGGNTMFNALGSVYGLFQSILATSQLLAAHWTTEFIAASVQMRTEAGHAASVTRSLGNAASSAAQAFYEQAAAIYAVIEAYLALQAIKGGGGSSIGNRGSNQNNEEAKASGGPVYAGSTYLVGEQGPELFTPHMSGYIIPNDDLSGGGDRSINVIFNGNVIGDERTISAYVTKAVSKGLRSAVYAGA